MSGLETYRIGRDTGCDVVLNHRSVSRLHAELTLAKSGKPYITDCGSNNGTYVGRGGKWVPIVQDFVEASEVLLIGRHQCTVVELLRSAGVPGPGGGQYPKHTGKPSGDGGQKKDLPSGRVMRDPRTGDIIGLDKG